MECFGWGAVVEGFAGSPVEFCGDFEEPVGAVDAEVGGLGEVLPEQWSGPRKLDLVMEL